MSRPRTNPPTATLRVTKTTLSRLCDLALDLGITLEATAEACLRIAGPVLVSKPGEAVLVGREPDTLVWAVPLNASQVGAVARLEQALSEVKP